MSTLANGNGLGFDPESVLAEADDAGRIADILSQAQALRAMRAQRTGQIQGPFPNFAPGEQAEPVPIPDLLRNLARPMGSPQQVFLPPARRAANVPGVEIRREDWPDPFAAGAAVRVPFASRIPQGTQGPAAGEGSFLASPPLPGALGAPPVAPPPPEVSGLWSRIAASAAEIQARGRAEFEAAPTDEAKLAIINQDRAEYGLPPSAQLAAKQTAGDVVGRLTTLRGAGGLVPFLSAGLEGKDLWDVYAATSNVEEGRATPADLETLAAFQEEALRQLRGYTIGGKAADIVGAAIPFIGEFVASGGVAGLIRAGGKKVAAKFASQAVKKAAVAAVRSEAPSLLRRATTGLARGATEAALRTPAFLPRIANDTVRALAPDYVLQPNDEKSLSFAINRQGSDFVPALRDALISNYIEVGSELAGGGIVRLGKGAVGAAASRIPGIRVAAERLPAFVAKAKTGVVTQLQRLFPERFPTLAAAAEFAERAGYHGVFGEIGEERLGQVLTWAAREGQEIAGLETRLDPGPLPGWEDLTAEFAAFAALGTAIGGGPVALDLGRKGFVGVGPLALDLGRKGFERISGRAPAAGPRFAGQGTIEERQAAVEFSPHWPKEAEPGWGFVVSAANRVRPAAFATQAEAQEFVRQRQSRFAAENPQAKGVAGAVTVQYRTLGAEESLDPTAFDRAWPENADENKTFVVEYDDGKSTRSFSRKSDARYFARTAPEVTAVDYTYGSHLLLRDETTLPAIVPPPRYPGGILVRGGKSVPLPPYKVVQGKDGGGKSVPLPPYKVVQGKDGRWGVRTPRGKIVGRFADERTAGYLLIKLQRGDTKRAQENETRPRVIQLPDDERTGVGEQENQGQSEGQGESESGQEAAGVAEVLTPFRVEQIPSGHWQVVGPENRPIASFATREQAELLATASRKAREAEETLAPPVPQTLPSERSIPTRAVPSEERATKPRSQEATQAAPPAGPRARAVQLDVAAQGGTPAFSVRGLRNKAKLVRFERPPPQAVAERLQAVGGFYKPELKGYLLGSRYNPEQIEAVIFDRPMPQSLPGQETPTPAKIAGRVLTVDPADVSQSTAYVRAIGADQARELLAVTEDKTLVLRALTQRGFTFGVDDSRQGAKRAKGVDYYLHPSRDWRWIDAGNQLRREVRNPQGQWAAAPTKKVMTFKRFAAALRPRLQEAAGIGSDEATKRRSDEGKGSGRAPSHISQAGRVQVARAAPIEKPVTRPLGILRTPPQGRDRFQNDDAQATAELNALREHREAGMVLGRSRVSKADREVYGRRRQNSRRTLTDWGYDVGYLNRLAKGWEPMPTRAQVSESLTQASRKRADRKTNTVELEAGRDYERDLDRYRARMRYDAKTRREVLVSDPLYMALEEAADAAKRRGALNDPKARERAGEARKEAQEAAKGRRFRRSTIKYVSLHQVPRPIREAMQVRARELLGNTRAGAVAKALQRIIDDLGSDKGGEVEHQKDRILGHLLAEIDTRTLQEREFGLPKPEADPIILFLLEPEEGKRRLWLADAMVLAAKPPSKLPEIGDRSIPEQLFFAAGQELRRESGTGLPPSGREIRKLLEDWAAIADAASGVAGKTQDVTDPVPHTPTPRVRGALNESDVRELTQSEVTGADVTQFEKAKLTAAFRHVETGEVFPATGEGMLAVEHDLLDVPEKYWVKEIEGKPVAVDPAIVAGFVDGAGDWVDGPDAWEHVAKRRTVGSLIRDAFPERAATSEGEIFSESDPVHRAALAGWLDAFDALDEAKLGLEGGTTMTDAMDELAEASGQWETLWGALPKSIGRGSSQFQAMRMLREKLANAEIAKLLGEEGTLEDELEFGPGMEELSAEDRRGLHERNEPCA